MLKKLLATVMVASFICGLSQKSFAQSSEAQAPLGWDFGIGLTSAPHGSGVNLNLASPALHHKVNYLGITNSGKLFFDLYQVSAKNFDSDDSGNLQSKLYHVLSAGYRLSSSYKSGNVFMIDIGTAKVESPSSFSDRDPWGLKVGFAIAVPGYAVQSEGKQRQNYLVVRLDQLVGTGEANKIANKPDVFDGAYISVGILINTDKIR